VGCGDLSFWERRDCESYSGIDISPTIVARNRKAPPNWRFAAANTAEYVPGLSGKIVLCLDLLFHIMNDDDFKKTLDNMSRYTQDMFFIYTGSQNPLGGGESEGV
jgi:hypothetical protein